MRRLSEGLQAAFPSMDEFSPWNLRSMRADSDALPEPEILQLVAVLPRGHNRRLVAAYVPGSDVAGLKVPRMDRTSPGLK